MQVDAALIRDLFAACRKMQRDLHFINGQALTVASFLESNPALARKAISNIDGMTNYIYSGAEGFPDVAKTLEATREVLKGAGEWMPFSDYVGFRPPEGEPEKSC